LRKARAMPCSACYMESTPRRAQSRTARSARRCVSICTFVLVKQVNNAELSRELRGVQNAVSICTFAPVSICTFVLGKQVHHTKLSRELGGVHDVASVFVLLYQHLRQYLYFCTSKASKHRRAQSRTVGGVRKHGQISATKVPHNLKLVVHYKVLLHLLLVYEALSY
jgi:hypothetical protein